MTGVDPAAAMLAVARSKPHAEQVEWVESSALRYKSHRRFDLIVMTGHAFYRSPHVTPTTSSTLRFPSREHVEALIVRSGLVVREVFGDWDNGPFEAARSREITFITEIAG